ncbi:hypothetical protein [Arenibacter certesii]|uniref:Uncharacterized protein n=1 Tax=Arenibacter certesii TaxID=228955 RepID=A0A918INM0_9FLAO|nr:hypothetical protein [Arenibacter certesii]GGW24432.1 hypothetical protein GCM10007383_06120 [Arenibacter certesii]
MEKYRFHLEDQFIGYTNRKKIIKLHGNIFENDEQIKNALKSVKDSIFQQLFYLPIIPKIGMGIDLNSFKFERDNSNLIFNVYGSVFYIYEIILKNDHVELKLNTKF